MLKIKLARFGKRNQPHYRIVVNEARSKRDGAYVALLGQYAPTQNPKILKIDLKEYQEWIKKGAQPTDTVASLAKRFESGNPFPEKPKKLSKKAKAKLEEAKNAKTEEKEVPVEVKEVEVENPAESTEEVAKVKPEVELSDEAPEKEEQEVKTEE
jgi:small subunit ribosomal protein S16